MNYGSLVDTYLFKVINKTTGIMYIGCYSSFILLTLNICLRTGRMHYPEDEKLTKSVLSK